MSQILIVLRLALIIFVVEGLVTFFLPVLASPLNTIGIRSEVGMAIIDAAASVSFSSPLIYFWVVRPYVSAQQHAEITLRDAIETISDGFMMYGADDHIVLCNKRYRNMFAKIADILVPGTKFEDQLQIGVKRGQYPEAIGQEDEWIAERIRLHRELREPIERRLPNGRWIKIAETRTSTGCTVGIRTDITDLKVREQLLRESEERLRQIVDSLHEGFVLYDAEDRLVMWNERWRNFHKETQDIIDVGVTFEQLLRASVSRKLYPEAFGREEEFIAERLAQHRNPGEPMIRQRRDGRWYIIREVATTEGGRFAISIDITDLKKAENAAQEARLQAERADKAKSEFLTNMSHELRTPLNAIIGFSDVMQSETFGPVGNITYRNYAKDINQSGLHLLALISDLLDLSKVESGTDELREESIKVPEIIRSAITLVRQHAQEKGVELELEVPDDSPALRADERKLKQILVNLLTNAIKFVETGGKVTLRTRCRAESGYVFQIIDTGVGIAPEDLPRALSQFGQVDSDLTRRYKGTGLGLPLTKALVELHGGSFDIQSEVGVGTTVTARFPAGRIIESSARTPRTPAA